MLRKTLFLLAIAFAGAAVALSFATGMPTEGPVLTLLATLAAPLVMLDWPAFAARIGDTVSAWTIRHRARASPAPRFPRLARSTFAPPQTGSPELTAFA